MDFQLEVAEARLKSMQLGMMQSWTYWVHLLGAVNTAEWELEMQEPENLTR